MFFIIIFSQVEDSPSQPWEFTVLHKDPASAQGPLWEMPDSNPYTAATEDWCTPFDGSGSGKPHFGGNGSSFAALV